MQQLILIVCPLKEPQRCEDTYLRSGPVGSMVQCLMNGPLQAANWAETQKGCAVKRWDCGRPNA